MAIQTILGTDVVKTTGLTKINNNFSELNTTTVKITGAQTIAGVKTFSDNIIASSKVGIGTTSPSEKLAVVGNIKFGTSGYTEGLLTSEASRNDGADIILRGTQGNSEQRFVLVDGTQGTDSGFAFETSADGGSNWTTEMQLVGGNVGIGTTSPGSKLSVVGLPTSATGLSSGDIWNDGGNLRIV